jgi:hypothetical protein
MHAIPLMQYVVKSPAGLDQETDEPERCALAVHVLAVTYLK